MKINSILLIIVCVLLFILGIMAHQLISLKDNMKLLKNQHNVNIINTIDSIKSVIFVQKIDSLELNNNRLKDSLYVLKEKNEQNERKIKKLISNYSEIQIYRPKY